MASFYPTLVTDKLVNTVNFYEDYFDFVPAVEKDGYVLMQKKADPSVCIAVFDRQHKCVAEFGISVQGLIVNIVERDVKTKWDDLYMEGLDIYKDFGTDINGADHFVVYDPNGILVNVHAPVQLS
jgi:hypothetical protein